MALLFFSEQGSLSVHFLHYKTLKNPQIKDIIEKQNGRTHVPVSGMGLIFLVGFSRFSQNQNNKMAEPMSQYLAWGLRFCFLFSEVFAICWKSIKTLKKEKTKMCFFGVEF